MSEESLFHRALAMPATERPAFLEQAGAGDDALHRRVEDLLRSQETPDSFLVNPAVNAEATSDSIPSPIAEAAGPGHRRLPQGH